MNIKNALEDLTDSQLNELMKKYSSYKPKMQLSKQEILNFLYISIKEVSVSYFLYQASRSSGSRIKTLSKSLQNDNEIIGLWLFIIKEMINTSELMNKKTEYKDLLNIEIDNVLKKEDFSYIYYKETLGRSLYNYSDKSNKIEADIMEIKDETIETLLREIMLLSSDNLPKNNLNSFFYNNFESLKKELLEKLFGKGFLSNLGNGLGQAFGKLILPGAATGASIYTNPQTSESYKNKSEKQNSNYLSKSSHSDSALAALVVIGISAVGGLIYGSFLASYLQSVEKETIKFMHIITEIYSYKMLNKNIEEAIS